MANMAELALASRLRRLSDLYWQAVTATYRQSGVEFDVRWATVFVLIARRGPIAITEMAGQLGITHPAVIQVVNELEKHKLIQSAKSDTDGRKRLLTLSEKGEAMIPQLQPLWDAFISVNRQMLNSQTHNLLISLQEMENQLAERGFFDRVQDELKRSKTTGSTTLEAISIVPYEPDYQPDFKRLNVEWIETYFRVESHDLEQLDHPERYVLPNNGQILLAKLGHEVVGCVAMINTRPEEGNTEFELAKMAVSPAAQGKGAGKLLALAAIDYARQLGAKTIWLESNRILTTALTMYTRVGFREVPSVPTPYARADIRMEMTL